MEELALILLILGTTGWIPIMVWWKHRIRLEEIRNQQGPKSNEEMVKAIREIQQELRSLRDTTTKFDMSFDAGISRLEDRVQSLERQSVTQDSSLNAWLQGGTSISEDSSTIKVGQGLR